MDRLAVTAGFFFFFFIFCSTTSIAFDVIDKTDNDVINGRDQSRTFPDQETKFPSTTLLPASEKPEDEPVPIERIPESDNTAAVESSSSVPELESVPLTIVSFRPIKRDFRSPGRTMVPFHRRHPCHRHHHQLVKPWGPGFRGREVSYGDDMLISGFKGVGPDPRMMFRGGERQMPERWVRFHPEETRFPDPRRERMRWAHLRKDEKRGEEEEEEEKHAVEEHHDHHHHDHHHQEKSWFMGKVRKFLDQF